MPALRLIPQTKTLDASPQGSPRSSRPVRSEEPRSPNAATDAAPAPEIPDSHNAVSRMTTGGARWKHPCGSLLAGEAPARAGRGQEHSPASRLLQGSDQDIRIPGLILTHTVIPAAAQRRVGVSRLCHHRRTSPEYPGEPLRGFQDDDRGGARWTHPCRSLLAGEAPARAGRGPEHSPASRLLQRSDQDIRIPDHITATQSVIPAVAKRRAGISRCCHRRRASPGDPG